MCKLRIGHGYDVHRLDADRRLILGGAEIDHTVGLLGHSDADVLVHAIMDSLIGALGLGDIGKHFPDTDDSYSGISSMELLKRVKELLMERGAEIVNIDATIIAQRPKLSPYIDIMRENISSVLKIDKSCVNVKATTEEHLGFTGREEGMAAHAVALIQLT
jgi:2-C-methyl-D-erythritol 2,4-cyclodiphosphate synthase